jgi:hypothetical protein
MAITIPKTVAVIGRYSLYTDYGDKGRYYLLDYCPCGGSTRIDLPSFFTERKNGKENDVCHVKQVSCSLHAYGWDTPLASGYGWHLYNKKDVTAEYFFYQSGYLLRYSVGQSRNGRSAYFQVEARSFKRDGTDRYGYYIWYYYPCFEVDLNFETGVITEVNARKGFQNVAIAEAHIPLREYGYQLQSDRFAAMHVLQQIVETGYNPVKWGLTDDAVSTFSRESGKTGPTGVYASTPSTSPASALKFDEYNLLFGSGMSTKPYAAYKLKVMEQEAYLDALDHIPQLNENSLANVIELVAFIKALVFDHRIEIPRSLQSAWLTYRYVYNTGKSDAEEAINFVHRNMNIDLSQGIACYGVTRHTFDGVDVTCRCRLDATQRELSTLDQIWTSLYRYGLSPSFYVVWDMIPYSFIVDWFIPVGDILNGYDKTHMYDRTYDMQNLVFSIKYSCTEDDIEFSAYTRWFKSELPEFQGYYTLENKGTTSSKVIGYRILDAMSILFR